MYTLLVPDVEPIVIVVFEDAAPAVPMFMALVFPEPVVPVEMLVVEDDAPLYPIVSAVEEANAANVEPPSTLVVKVGAVALTGIPEPVPEDHTGAEDPPYVRISPLVPAERNVVVLEPD